MNGQPDYPGTRFDRVISLLSQASAWFAWACLWGMVIIILVDITGRRFLGRSTQMADELSGYFLVVITFMGAAYTLLKGRHISVDVIVMRLAAKPQRLLSVCTAIAGLVFIAVMVWYSLKMALSSLKYGSLSGTMLNIPLFIPQLVAPVGLSILALAAATIILKLIRSNQHREEIRPAPDQRLE